MAGLQKIPVRYVAKPRAGQDIVETIDYDGRFDALGMAQTLDNTYEYVFILTENGFLAQRFIGDAQNWDITKKNRTRQNLAKDYAIWVHETYDKLICPTCYGPDMVVFLNNVNIELTTPPEARYKPSRLNEPDNVPKTEEKKPEKESIVDIANDLLFGGQLEKMKEAELEAANKSKEELKGIIREVISEELVKLEVRLVRAMQPKKPTTARKKRTTTTRQKAKAKTSTSKKEEEKAEAAT